MRRPGTIKRRLAALKTKRPAEPTSFVAIYRAGTDEVLNGPIPPSVHTTIWIPDNSRGDVIDGNE